MHLMSQVRRPDPQELNTIADTSTPSGFTSSLSFAVLGLFTL